MKVLVSPDAINDELLPALLTRDVDRVFEFLSTHVKDRQSIAQMFETMPRLVSALIENHPGMRRREDDEMWTFEHITSEPEAKTTMQARLVITALNGDDETLTALVKSLLEWHPLRIEEVLAGLMALFISIAESFAASPNSEDGER